VFEWIKKIKESGSGEVGKTPELTEHLKQEAEKHSDPDHRPETTLKREKSLKREEATLPLSKDKRKEEVQNYFEKRREWLRNASEEDLEEEKNRNDEISAYKKELLEKGKKIHGEKK
jgi:hypothetical protein